MVHTTFESLSFHSGPIINKIVSSRTQKKKNNFYRDLNKRSIEAIFKLINTGIEWKFSKGTHYFVTINQYL